MSVWRFLARRLAASLFVLAGVSVLVFCLARVIPGDPARIALGGDASREQVEALRRDLWLDKPLPTQYLRFIEGALHGDLGVSLYNHRPVTETIRRTLPVTLELILVAALLTAILGVPLGIVAARWRDGPIDNITRLFSLLGAAAPSFVWAILLMLGFAYTLQIFPIAGRLSESVRPPPVLTGMIMLDSLFAGDWRALADAARHIALPALALSLSGIAQIARMTRANMVEVYDSAHVELARAFSFGEATIALKYALRPALIPTLTLLGLQVAALLGNAFLVEAVFGYPGIAQFGVQAILQKDLNGIVGSVLVIAAAFLAANMAVDIAVAFVDPRIRLGARHG
ncbi:MAG: ABC transporter permease [Alphaproteobacteria bacterium]|nr:ABC transporter permease [Alphaproteobacteria bacterium]